jgi:hypothetical protein
MTRGDKLLSQIINSPILFGMWKSFLSSGRRLLLFQFTARRENCNNYRGISLLSAACIISPKVKSVHTRDYWGHHCGFRRRGELLIRSFAFVRFWSKMRVGHVIQLGGKCEGNFWRKPFSGDSLLAGFMTSSRIFRDLSATTYHSSTPIQEDLCAMRSVNAHRWAEAHAHVRCCDRCGPSSLQSWSGTFRIPSLPKSEFLGGKRMRIDKEKKKTVMNW